MRSLTLTDVARLLHIPCNFSGKRIQGFNVDSRSLKPGELFFALTGERVDGHNYLAEVKNKGAIGAIIAKQHHINIPDLPCITVDDPLTALQQLAAAVLKSSPSRIVAVTGSVGKTSTKDFINQLLASRYKVAASHGNNNSQIGMPLSILNTTNGSEDILVLEIGMTTPGHISRLINIAPPEVALITTVALVHAANFQSLQEIACAKGEIFTHPHTRLAILPSDIANYEHLLMIGQCPKRSFSLHDSAAYYHIWRQKENLWLKIKDKDQQFALQELSLPGCHNLHNLLAAIAVADYFDIHPCIINNIIPKLQLPAGRMQYVHHPRGLFINDSYNASEISVKAALDILSTTKSTGRKIAVLGSMLELGQFSIHCHLRVAEHALQHVDVLYCLGHECQPMYDLWTKMQRPVHLFHDRIDLVNTLRQDLFNDDVILLKGSHSKALWKVLEEI